MVPIGFLVLSIIMAVTVVVLFYRGQIKTGVDAIKARKHAQTFGLIILLWWIYLYCLSKTGIIADYSLPPKFLLFILIPLISSYIYFFRRHKNNPIYQRLPLRWTTGMQSFRIPVEILLHYTFLAGVIPASATYHGLNYDILMGITGALFFLGAVQNKRLLKAWNIIGIFMIVIVAAVITTSSYAPHLWGATEPLVSLEFFRLPYLFLAGFLAPLAIFLHVVSLIQLRK